MRVHRRAVGGAVEAVGAVALPPGRPLGLEALEGGLVGHPAIGAWSPGPPSRSRRVVMIGLPYPACCASTTPRPATVGTARAARAGPGVHVRLRADRLRPAPPRPRPVLAGLRRPAPLPEFTGLEVRYVSNITDIDDNIIDRASERGIEPSGGGRGSTRRRGGRPWTPRGAAPDRDRPTPPPTSIGWSSSSPSWSSAGSPTRPSDGVYLSVADVPGLRAAGPPDPRLAAGRGAGRGRRGEALAARLRPVEEGQAGRADLGRRRGARAGPAGTPNAW